MNKQTLKTANRLDNAQMSAVSHDTGPALVVAGPGSGKTTVILNRVLYLIQQCHIPPEQILVLTFTRAAAKSLQSRFLDFIGGEVLPVTFGTFHSIFYQILKQYGSYKNSQVITTKEKYRLIRDLGVNDNTLLSDICYAFGYKLNNPDGNIKSILPAHITETEFRTLFHRYLRQLQLEDMLDFDQMADLTLDLLKQKPYVLQRLQEQYRYVLVDEFQDTNPHQYEFLKRLVKESRELFAVGDDDQAIYSFRGSSPFIMKQFLADFQETKYYDLIINYRSCTQIVEDANKVIRQNKNRFWKEMKSISTELGEVKYYSFENREQEYAFVIQQIRKMSLQVQLSEMAIIGRTNRQVEQLRQVFTKEGIKFKTNGLLSGNTYSIVTEQLMELLEYIEGNKAKGRLFRILGNVSQEQGPSFWKDKHAKLFMNHLVKNMHYLEYLETLEGDTESMKREFSILLKESGRCRTIPSFLELLRKRKQIQKEAAEGVHLLTMHGAKGLEFEYVCLIDINEGIVPGKQCVTASEIEEERRMLYVGMTRAKKILDVCYLKGTKEHPRLMSRFLNPLLKETRCAD